MPRYLYDDTTSRGELPRIYEALVLVGRATCMTLHLLVLNSVRRRDTASRLDCKIAESLGLLISRNITQSTANELIWVETQEGKSLM